MKQRHDGKVQIARDGWFADYNDAMTFFDLIRCGSSQNTVGYCNKQMDALVDEGNQKLDDQARTALLTQAHDMAMKDTPMVPLFQYSADRLVKPYVGGYSLKNVIDMRASQDLYLIKH
ncbi:extracellular solute-binding protein [Burkholderia cenocepacia]|nr:extracellular solute-binding protein [Burkholderia cenocepacia]